MKRYFAYGSNMLQARLEARIGAVKLVGAAVAEGYVHSFTKLGRDGTGKGNIQAAVGAQVYGVVYGLQPTQFAQLTEYELGYRLVVLSVCCNGHLLDAVSFQAQRPVAPLLPRDEYIGYYQRGMREHRLPPDYRALVLGQAVGERS